MGYLLLAISQFFGSTKSYCGKRASGLLQGYTGSIAGNLLRVSVCAVIGFVLVLTAGQLSGLKLSFPALGVCGYASPTRVATLPSASKKPCRCCSLWRRPSSAATFSKQRPPSIWMPLCFSL